MATREQCIEAMRRKIKSRGDFDAFRRTWMGGVIDHGGTESEFLNQNIESIARIAHREGNLDKLGIALGLPSDAESGRILHKRTERRATIALVISGLALVVSVGALLVNWMKATQ